MNKLVILTTVAFLGSLSAVSAHPDGDATAPVARKTVTVKHPEHIRAQENAKPLAHHKARKNHLKGDFPKGNHSASEETQ
jgi:hypothetical protein